MDTHLNIPVALLNGTVATTNGVYTISDMSIEEAKLAIEERGFISAIGHEATAEIMKELMEVPIKMNRIEFYQEVGQIAVVFKLNRRPEEGRILTREEVEEIGYSLKKMERLS